MNPTRKPITTVLLLLGLATASLSSPDALAIPSICEGKGFSTCFTLLLQQRCASYANYNLLSKRENRCEHSVIDMVKLFDPYQPKGEVIIVAFPKKIGELITNPKSFAFLRDLPATLESSIREGKPFRLWDYAVMKSGQDEMLALEWISVFLQDTNLEGNFALEFSRVNFETKKERKLTPKELDVWSKAIAAVSYERLTDRSEISDAMLIRPYPRIDTEFLSKGFYHFYFSAYVARALQASRKSVTVSGKDMNGFAPFLLNAMYEMHVDIDENLSPLKDAKPFNAMKKAHSMGDIYSGYLGSLFGLGGAELVAKAEPYSSFSKRFAKNPSGTMQSLYKNFIPK